MTWSLLHDQWLSEQDLEQKAATCCYALLSWYASASDNADISARPLRRHMRMRMRMLGVGRETVKVL